MNLKENISLAFAGLKANKMRAFLTMLGIIIGISSVIMITTLGLIMKKNVTASYDSIGTNLVQIMLVPKPDATRQYLVTDDLINDKMIQNYKEQFADKIGGLGLNCDVTVKGKTIINDKAYSLTTSGINKDLSKIMSINIIRGRMISDKDIKEQKKICIIPKEQAEKCYGNQNPLGKEMTIRYDGNVYDFTIVGVYDKKEGGIMEKASQAAMEAMMGGTSTDYTIYIPVSTASEMEGQKSGLYFNIMVNGAEGVNIDKFAKDSVKFFNRRFYSKNDSVQCQSVTSEQELEMVTGLLSIVQSVISIIAAISLLVGGIGVMNIMLVSVTERTKEIGIRKALGAKNSAIRVQFITEAIIICLIGGFVGIVLGVLTGNLIGLLLGTVASPSVFAIVGSLIFSMGIGVFFGYYPANKAAKMDPIEALRYE